MQLVTYLPQPPLSDFVDLFWLSMGPAPAHRQELLLPMATTELVIDLRATTGLPNPHLCGPHSVSIVIDTAPQTAILGVHFKPGGAFPFFKEPASELHNTRLTLDYLWGGRAAELRERLLAATPPLKQFQNLERFLLAQAARPLARHPAVNFALRAFQDVAVMPSVAAVVDRTGWSQRRFIEVFRNEVGLTPKLFCRVARFQRALREIQSKHDVDWACLAVSCGYYDQSHLVHEFQAFSGFTPTAYLQSRGEHMNHVPLAD